MLVEVEAKAEEDLHGALPARDRHDQIEHLDGATNILHQTKYPDEKQKGDRLILKQWLLLDPLAPFPVRRDNPGLLSRLRRRLHAEHANPVEEVDEQAAGHLGFTVRLAIGRRRAAEPRGRGEDQEPRVGGHQQGGIEWASGVPELVPVLGEVRAEAWPVHPGAEQLELGEAFEAGGEGGVDCSGIGIEGAPCGSECGEGGRVGLEGGDGVEDGGVRLSLGGHGCSQLRKPLALLRSTVAGGEVEEAGWMEEAHVE